MFEIDFLYNTESQLLEIIKAYTSKDGKFNLHTYSLMPLKQLTQNIQVSSEMLPEKFSDIVIIEELDSFLDTEEIYDSINARIPSDAVKIIMSANHNFYNVVQWIRKGATDVLYTSTLTETIFTNSILFSQSYIRSQMKPLDFMEDDSENAPRRIKYANSRIILPKDYDWQSVGEQENLDMTVMMISFELVKQMSTHSIEDYDELYEGAKKEIIRLTKFFGGLQWFWTRNIGTIAFHFGDHINTAVTAAIHFINEIAITYIERLKMKDSPTFSISIHTGRDIFRLKDTEDIHSNIVNFTAHLLTKFTPSNSICISDDVYNKMSVRLQDFFTEFGSFEDHGIYKY